MTVSRTKGLVVERLEDELLVYDTETDEAHQLIGLAATVFECCDGGASLDEIAAEATTRVGEPVDRPAVEETVLQLAERRLVTSSAGLSRREAVRRVAVAGATAAVAVPIIKSIVAPTPAQALVSCVPNGGSCLTDDQCCSLSCAANVCADAP